MATYLISEDDLNKIKSSAILSNNVTLHSTDSEAEDVNYEKNYYKIELTQTQKDESCLKEHFQYGNFHYGHFSAARLQGYNLESEIAQLGMKVGCFQYESYCTNRINEEYIFNILKQRKRDAGPILRFELSDAHGRVLMCSDYDPVSTVDVYYNPYYDTFSVEATYSHKTHRDVLEDFDDPYLTRDNVPELLYYLDLVLRAKSYSWLEEGKIQ